MEISQREIAVIFLKQQRNCEDQFFSFEWQIERRTFSQLIRIYTGLFPHCSYYLDLLFFRN